MEGRSSKNQHRITSGYFPFRKQGGRFGENWESRQFR